MDRTTVKTSFGRVFEGDQDQLNRLQSLLRRMQKLRVVTTHFIKWYASLRLNYQRYLLAVEDEFYGIPFQLDALFVK
jgi:hypothetical protein